MARLKVATKQPRRAKGSGSVYRDGDAWRGSITIEGKRHKVRAQTESLAWARLDAIRNGQSASEAAVASESLNAWADRCWRRMEYSGASESTVIGYQSLYERYVQPELGHLALNRISNRDVRRVLDLMRDRGLSNSSRLATRTTMSRLFYFAQEDELILTNPARGVRVGLPGSGFLVEGWDERRAKQVLNAVQHSPLRDLYALLMYTLIREGEALSLDWSRVHLAKRELTLVSSVTKARGLPGSGHRTRTTIGLTKTRRARTVHIPEEAVRLLWSRYERMGRPKAGLVFAQLKGDTGNPVSSSWALKHFRKCLADAGLPAMRLHDLRHGGASILLAKGVPVVVVSKLLGHKDVATTHRVYSHVLAGQDRVASELLQFFSPGKGRVPGDPRTS